jgi:hypothetical protein
VIVSAGASAGTFNFTETGSGTIITTSSTQVVPGSWTGSSGTRDNVPILNNSNIRIQE